uniref:Peptidase S1 domain-containing protein n=1 Tax=Bos mutus grunniens TaxID=30521 RepID=A0A8B9WK32_BOSMU
MQLFLLLMAFLPPGLGKPFLSEEITGGHEAKPHSRPYMALVQFWVRRVGRSVAVFSYKRTLFDSCSLQRKGDSGGPLVCKKVVHGTFSYGKKNGTPPGVFTQVSHFLPWIKRTMKHL